MQVRDLTCGHSYLHRLIKRLCRKKSIANSFCICKHAESAGSSRLWLVASHLRQVDISPQVVVVPIFRVKLDGAGEVGYGLPVALKRSVDVGSVVVEDRLCRVKLDGTAVIGDGLPVVLQRGVDITPDVVEDRLCRVKLDGAAVIGDGLLAFP